MNSLLLYLFLTAQTLSGYRTEAAMPTVEFVKKAWLQQEYCPGQGCNIAGIYSGGNVVYLSDRLAPEENPVHASVVLHEFVHFLQQDAKHYVMAELSCPEYMGYEKEAYAVQFAYLESKGVRPPPITAGAFSCEGR